VIVIENKTWYLKSQEYPIFDGNQSKENHFLLEGIVRFQTLLLFLDHPHYIVICHLYVKNNNFYLW